jgi:SAM-dependent methyltransferase
LDQNPIVAFYTSHGITTDHHNLDDLSLHFSRREKLYRALGLPPALLSGRTVLEVGPGRGHNALPMFAWGANMVFCEPNPSAQMGLHDMLSDYHIDPARWVLHSKAIEDMETDASFDVIVAEGFLPGLMDRTEVIASMDKLLRPGGVVVTNCADELSYFFEIVKRMIGRRLLKAGGVENLDEQVALLKSAFSSHFAKLTHATRDIADWILDQFLNPAVFGKPFSLIDSTEEFGQQYTLMGSSPNIFTDLSWYKDLDHDRHGDIRIQFARKRHVLLHMGLEEGLRSAQDNDRLVRAVKRFFLRAKAADEDFTEDKVPGLVQDLRQVQTECENLDPHVARAVREGVELLQCSVLDPEQINRADTLAGAFGKGIQYVSLVKSTGA